MSRHREMIRPISSGVLLMLLLAALFTAAPARAAMPGPIFDYPQQGQRLGHASAFLFRVGAIAGATSYEWSFFQNGQMVWQNWRDEGRYSDRGYEIWPGTKGHTRFWLGSAEVAVRALVNGTWTDYTRKTILITPPISMPVLQLNFYPPDPKRPEYVDRVETGLKQDVLVSTIQAATRQMVEQSLPVISDATRYRGYRDPAAQRYLEYWVLDKKDFFIPMPRGHKLDNGRIRPDYGMILNEQNVCDYVDNRGVKEVWIYGYHNDTPGGIEPDESRMHSRYGDVSNSRPKEEEIEPEFQMPKCNNSYVMYNFTWQASGDFSNTVHNRLHQIENVIFFAENQGYPPSETNVIGSLFWDDFSVYGDRGLLPGYRSSCGNTHRPPNTDIDYLYNSDEVRSNNCATWHPDETQTQYVDDDCYQWNCTPTGFYTWFMQNMPGYRNGIVFNGEFMRNWWEAMADFNRFIDDRKSLYTSAPAEYEFYMAANALTVQESDGWVYFTVNLSEPVPAGQSLWVDFAITPGTATVNSDYASTGGTLIFTGGQTSQFSRIAILEDGKREGAEFFTINLVAATHGRLGTATSTVVTIAANDSLTLPAFETHVDEGTGALIEITLNAPSAQSVTVSYATQDGTALAGRDYVATSGTVTFAPGETRRLIGVSAIADGVTEGNESFTLNLSAPSNAQLGKPASMTVTIVENSTRF